MRKKVTSSLKKKRHIPYGYQRPKNRRSVRVFVSGTYDVLHGGHVQFFEDAKALGNHLTVSAASAEVVKLLKNRVAALPDDHKIKLITSLKCVDKVVLSTNREPIFDFRDYVENSKPDIIAVTEDDKHIADKEMFCEARGIRFVILPKHSSLTAVSTTSIRRAIRGHNSVPLRVDFGGGWLDVPRFALAGGYIVNCAITLLVTDVDWPYELAGGLGGSAARAILDVRGGVTSELKLGVGWQDPAVIAETGLCVWRSGHYPVLDSKHNPDWLRGRLLIKWTGQSHSTPNLSELRHDFELIKQAGIVAREAARNSDLRKLAKAVSLSYEAQLSESMQPLQRIAGAIAMKYLGGGHGGYALYLFKDSRIRDKAASRLDGTKAVELYLALPNT